MKSYSSREIIQIIREDGWYEVSQEGSHKQFKHPVKTGKVTVPDPKKDIPLRTFKSIMKQAGLEI